MTNKFNIVLIASVLALGACSQQTQDRAAATADRPGWRAYDVDGVPAVAYEYVCASAAQCAAGHASAVAADVRRAKRPWAAGCAAPWAAAAATTGYGGAAVDASKGSITR